MKRGKLNWTKRKGKNSSLFTDKILEIETESLSESKKNEIKSLKNISKSGFKKYKSFSRIKQLPENLDELTTKSKWKRRLFGNLESGFGSKLVQPLKRQKSKFIKETSPYTIIGMFLFVFCIMVLILLWVFNYNIIATNQNVSDIINEMVETNNLLMVIISGMLVRMFFNYAWDQYTDKPQGGLGK